MKLSFVIRIIDWGMFYISLMIVYVIIALPVIVNNCVDF